MLFVLCCLIFGLIIGHSYSSKLFLREILFPYLRIQTTQTRIKSLRLECIFNHVCCYGFYHISLNCFQVLVNIYLLLQIFLQFYDLAISFTKIYLDVIRFMWFQNFNLNIFGLTFNIQCLSVFILVSPLFSNLSGVCRTQMLADSLDLDVQLLILSLSL